MKEKINIWEISAYFIFYSFLGYLIETVYAILTTGLLECRQSFLYGPFLRNIWNRCCYDYYIITLF